MTPHSAGVQPRAAAPAVHEPSQPLDAGRNIGGGGAAHGGADDDGTEEWDEGVYHQRQETRLWHEAA
ncbi:hypothetical protein T492DRAFT_868259 [Pavlovales sp. CCMP2436]|nr:hypothetical protein T492DRAFT_868259 [Pavlovales sp. CCMP2436]